MLMLVGLISVLLAGAMNGSWAAPMKRVTGWEWENTWLAWAFLAMVVIPLAIAASTVPNLAGVYGSSGVEPLARTALYGMLWGVSAILFGLGIARIGLALGFGIILGVGASLGALVPFVKLHSDRLFTPAGLLTLAGVSVILAGVAFCARAGLLREAVGGRRQGEGSFAAGLVICLLSGLGSMFMSVALNEATPICKVAESFGTPQSRSLDAVWPVLLGAGFLVNGAYCLYRLSHRRSAVLFSKSVAFNLLIVTVMAALWSGSNFVYGAGARGMGPLGLVLGWPVFMAAIVLTANGWGILSGEWRGAGGAAVTWSASGSALLVTGIAILAAAGRAS
jgi:L-rhamnose-H+ transport protein